MVRARLNLLTRHTPKDIADERERNQTLYIKCDVRHTPCKGAVIVLTIPYGGMVQRHYREFPSLQENHEHRIRTRTPEYLEFFPVS